MIRYQLLCDESHRFEGWFRSSDDFDRQQEACELACPVCASATVKKAIMAPAIAKGSSSAGGAPSVREERLQEIKSGIADAARRAREYVERNFDYVGDKFPEEARKIHYNESEARQIYGEATAKEAKELSDEGVAIAPLPAASGADVAKEKKLN
jgi:hypothetical protein